MKSVREFEEVLKAVYAENDFPSERLIKSQDALQAFTSEFNSRTGGQYASEEIAGVLERIRKDKEHTGGLPRVGRSYGGPHFRNKPR